jgi:tetratricopeptide (TPR) repeat protein
MPYDHPKAEEIQAFLEGKPGGRDAGRDARILRHLLAGCSVCDRTLEALGWSPERLERLLYLPGDLLDDRSDAAPAAGRYDYDLAFAKAERALDEFLAPPRATTERPEDLFAELENLPPAERWRAAEEERFRLAGLVERVVEKSRRLRYEDPEQMIGWAELARRLADSCTPEIAGSARKLADLRASAWSQYSNALRVGAQLPEAESAMMKAQALLAAGTGNPVLRAHLLHQMASLHTTQRRFEAAIGLLEEAAEIYRDLGDDHRLAQALVMQATAYVQSGEAESAIRLLNRAIPRIDQEQDPYLLLAACHNLVLAYVHLDEPEQALSLYSETRHLYRELDDPLILLRSAWQEGMLLRDLGHLRAAEAALLRARDGFLERKLSYEVAVIALDLAAIYVKLGEGEKLRETVATALPIFRALRVQREMIASLLQLQQMAGQEQTALELIRRLNAQLESLGHRSILG